VTFTLRSRAGVARQRGHSAAGRNPLLRMAWPVLRAEWRARWAAWLGAIALMIPATLLLANAIAAIPGWSAARIRPGVTLRTQ
jgi:hypothetical protein